MDSPVYWPDESLPLAIYCAPGILTGLEAQAIDGLLAMPRTGLGIGGLLLGRQSGKRLEILKTVAISCSHAMGPSFVLTPEELAEAKASEEGVDGECGLVGWYCSKPNGRMVLSENDEALFDALCGDRGQVALLIRPKLGYVTLATFALRGDGQDGDRFRLGAQGDLVAPEKITDSEPELAAGDGVAAVEAAPQPLVPELPLEEPSSDAMVTAEERPAIRFMPRDGTLFGVRLEETPKRGPSLARRLLWVFILLAALAAATGYLTRIYLPASGISK
jgi:proteasome lid subunit RPN8/RPN11